VLWDDSAQHRDVVTLERWTIVARTVGLFLLDDASSSTLNDEVSAGDSPAVGTINADHPIAGEALSRRRIEETSDPDAVCATAAHLASSEALTARNRDESIQASGLRSAERQGYPVSCLHRIGLNREERLEGEGAHAKSEPQPGEGVALIYRKMGAWRDDQKDHPGMDEEDVSGRLGCRWQAAQEETDCPCVRNPLSKNRAPIARELGDQLVRRFLDRAI
jgi:hypothetical protein